MNAARLWDLIDDVEVAMMTTSGPFGELMSRPLVAARVDHDDGTLWFFTSTQSPKVAQLQREQHVNLAYATPERQIYVSVCGLASLSRDADALDRLWSPAYQTWFADGRDDPHLALVCVRVASAQYWSHDNGWVATTIGAQRALPPADQAAIAATIPAR